MPPRLLVISFAFPPSATPRAIQVARLLTHLDREMVLLCADFRDPNDRSDPTLSQLENGHLKVVRVPFRRTRRDEFIAIAADRFKLPIVNKSPDIFKKWKTSVLAAISSVTHPHSWDALITFGAPMTDHLAGLQLKKRLCIPWIAHFSDPWVDNPFTSADPLTNALNRSFERRVLSSADRILFTSEETVDLVLGKYPVRWKAKTRVLPHAFDSTLFLNRKIKGDETTQSKIIIRYLGDFYGPRSPKPLLAALVEIVRRNPAVVENVQFEFVGNLGSSGIDLSEFASLPPELVCIKSPVGYEESLRLMRDADGLLVIDAPLERSVFLPSKLVEYIGADRPVFGISPPGTTAKLIAELGGCVTDPGDYHSISVELIEFISFLREARARGIKSWGAPHVRSRFEISTVVRSFRAILNELVPS